MSFLESSSVQFLQFSCFLFIFRELSRVTKVGGFYCLKARGTFLCPLEEVNLKGKEEAFPV